VSLGGSGWGEGRVLIFIGGGCGFMWSSDVEVADDGYGSTGAWVGVEELGRVYCGRREKRWLNSSANFGC
jgi:hypothetical protein